MKMFDITIISVFVLFVLSKAIELKAYSTDAVPVPNCKTVVEGDIGYNEC